MESDKRKRINVSVDAETYDELYRIVRKYGFKNLCELSVAMLNVFVRFYRQKADLTNEEFRAIPVQEIFYQLSEWFESPERLDSYITQHKEQETETDYVDIYDVLTKTNLEEGGTF